MVRAEGADPPLTVSLTVKYPCFLHFLFLRLSRNYTAWSEGEHGRTCSRRAPHGLNGESFGAQLVWQTSKQGVSFPLQK